MIDTRPVLFRLFVTSQKVGQVLEAALAGSPVRLEDATLLDRLARLEPVTPTSLAEHLGLSPSTLTYRLKAVEARGWVGRTPNPADGRSSLLALTPAGRAAWDEAAPAFRAGLHSIDAGLGVPAEDVVAALAALEAAAEAALGGAAVPAEPRATVRP